jgi:hypothetical protein
MDSYINLGALLVATLALLVSILSWRASMLAVRATTFDQRYGVYADAERFLSAWMRDGRPDMSLLSVLVGAWSRSHFLCNERVTRYLRKLWTDAVTADYHEKVVRGETTGDHAQSVKIVHELLLEHHDFDKLRTNFMGDLKV